MKDYYFHFRSGYSYEDALRLQGVLNGEGYHGILMIETPDTITLGRGSDVANELAVTPEFLRERGVNLLSTDRGGSAIWHGGGQLVGFPIANLKKLYGDARAVKRFTDELLLGLAHACAVLGVKNVETRPDSTGLWTKKGKLASLGISVKDGFVFHGFSLNVTTEVVSGFSLLNSSDPVTSLENEGVRVGSMQELSTLILPYLTVVNGWEIFKQAPTVSYDEKVSALMARVAGSPMALDHFLQKDRKPEELH
jgi:lipoyl(octanoyl) transferase